MKIRYTFFVLAVMSLGLYGCQKLPQQTPDKIEFTILQLNDVYEIAPLEGGRAGGLARVATIRQELVRENPNTIAVIAGDFLSPSLTGNLKTEDGERIAGRQMVETLNAMGLDYATFGNHEFDLRDLSLLQKRIDQSTFRYASCNVLKRVDGATKPFTQQVGGKEVEVPGYIIHEFSNASGKKVRVAIVGVVLPFNKAPYVDYLPVESAFENACREAQANADVVIALTHLAIEQDMQLAAKVPGVLLFIGGHDHTNMMHTVGNTVITKADANAKTVYIHRISFDPASTKASVRSSLRRIDNTIPSETATQAVVDRWQQVASKIMNNMGYYPERVLMTTTEPLVCTEALVRSTPTNFGQLTTKAFEYVWPGADAYLLNGGSMRLDDNLSGVVTEYDILRTFPFGGDIVRMELPGDVLEKVLHAGRVTNMGEGGYLQLGHITCKDQCLINGKPVDPGRRYTVVMPRFVAEGREQNMGFLAEHKFQEQPSLNVNGKAVRNDIRDIVIAYMTELGKK